MSTVLTKLGVKSDTQLILLYKKDAPQLLKEYSNKKRRLKDKVAFAAVKNFEELVNIKNRLFELSNDETRIWITYPKKSGDISSDLNRDIIWKEIEKDGFSPVSSISVDDTWSAMRLKPSKTIKRQEKTFSEKDVPEEFVLFFKTNSDVEQFYKDLAPSYKKEYNKWILSAKREDTRKKRVEKAFKLLKQGIKTPI